MQGGGDAGIVPGDFGVVEIFYVAEGEEEFALEVERDGLGVAGVVGVAQGEVEAELGVQADVVERRVVPDSGEFDYVF